MNVSLGNSKRVALDFVKAEIRSAKMAKMSCSDLMRANTVKRMALATEALQADPIAQQLLPMAREYHRQQLARRQAVNATLLSKVNRSIGDFLEGDQPLGEGNFKETLIDDVWKDVVHSLNDLDEQRRVRLCNSLLELLCSLRIDIENADLPPIPKFTI